MSEDAPEIIDEIATAYVPNIVKDGPRLRRERAILQQRHCFRQTRAIKRQGPPVPPWCLGAPTTRVAPVAGS